MDTTYARTMSHSLKSALIHQLASQLCLFEINITSLIHLQSLSN